MNKNVLMTVIVPHPPIIVPEVGKGKELEAGKTVSGLAKLSSEIVAMQPETIVVVTPHSEFNPYFFSVYSGKILYGDLRRFGAPFPKIEFDNDLEFVNELELKIKETFIKLNPIPENIPLDHGSFVPLYYFAKAGYKGKIVVINYTMLDNQKHKLFGKFIAETAEKLDRKIIFAASGDLSHKLTPSAPAGYELKAIKYDQIVENSIKNGDYNSITNISPDLRNLAGDCAYNSMMIAFGVINDTPQQNEIISYEHPFGVGYIVAKF